MRGTTPDSYSGCMATQNPYVDSLATLALTTEREVEALLQTAFNLNELGEVEDKGTSVAALKVCAHINAAIIRLSQFQNSVLNRATGT